MKKLFFIFAFALGTWGTAQAQTTQVSNEYTAALQKMMEVSNGLDAAQQVMIQLFAVLSHPTSALKMDSGITLSLCSKVTRLSLEKFYSCLTLSQRKQKD